MKINIREWLRKFKCENLDKHVYKYGHAYVVRHIIFIVYKCKHCGKEQVIQKKD